MQDQLQWSFLEVDEEEWQRHTCGPDISAAANGFPMVVRTIQDAGTVPQSHWTRGTLVAAAVALLLAAAVGFGAWYRAQQGLDHMEHEVANVVMLEKIQAHVDQPQQREHATVESTAFLDGKAMAEAVITRTWSSGQVFVYRQAQFFEQTAHGWQRTAPAAVFWGPVQELDTAHLHFVFRSKDRAAAEQLAPGLEALYAALRRTLGQELTAAGDRLTVEIVPAQVSADERFLGGRLRLTSPVLYELSFGFTSADLLASLARHELAAEMLAATLRTLPIKKQWQPQVDALRTWLNYSDDLPLAPAAGNNPLPVGPSPASAVPLADLLGCSPCATADPPVSMYNQDKSAATVSLFDFIFATCGPDKLAALLAGFSRYEDWDALSPAVFGRSAVELEAAWRAWEMRQR